MNRVFKCNCGGTAWIERGLDQVIIQCDRCQASVGGFTLTEIRQEWQHRYGVKAKPGGDGRAGDQRRASDRSRR